VIGRDISEQLDGGAGALFRKDEQAREAGLQRLCLRGAIKGAIFGALAGCQGRDQQRARTLQRSAAEPLSSPSAPRLFAAMAVSPTATLPRRQQEMEAWRTGRAWYAIGPRRASGRASIGVFLSASQYPKRHTAVAEFSVRENVSIWRRWREYCGSEGAVPSGPSKAPKGWFRGPAYIATLALFLRAP
jgi:hypothetical protein